MEYSNSRIREIISEWIHNERDRWIMSDRLTNGMTFDALAAKYEMSDRQIKRIVKKLQTELFKHL